MKLRKWLRQLGSNIWHDWPERAYRAARYQLRLSAVQEHLAECIDMAPPGPVRILSMCAGDGRDVIGVLTSHPRRSDVAAWLVELDQQSVAAGVSEVEKAALHDSVRFIHGDATAFATYIGIAPFDIVLLCGVWGHVQTHERALLVRAMATLCKPGGTVLWTRGVSKGMARLDEVQSHFAGSSWQKVRMSLTPDRYWAVTTHRYCGPAAPLPATGQIFHFLTNAG